MMRGRVFVALMLVAAAPLAAAPRQASHKPDPAPPPAEAKLIQSCDAHKFETIVDTVVDAQPKKSKVKLCGVEGQSDADWLGTLRDAVRKLEANKEMAPATRDQIVAAIKSEIARLSMAAPPVPAKREAQVESAAPQSRDYAALPPLPGPMPAPPPTVPEAPMATVTASPAPATTIPAPVAPASAVPKLTIICESPDDFTGPAPCAEFERDTRLTVKADGEVPAGTSLEFVRNGRPMGDLSLGGLSRGGALRSALPPSVCSGFGAGKLELSIVQANGTQVVRSEGTYVLRC